VRRRDACGSVGRISDCPFRNENTDGQGENVPRALDNEWIGAALSRDDLHQLDNVAHVPQNSRSSGSLGSHAAVSPERTMLVFCIALARLC
jgi:hypothetical protein